MMAHEPTLFEKSRPGRRGPRPPRPDVEPVDLEAAVPAGMLRAEPPGLPEVSEFQVMRHFMRLSQRNYSVDTNFYPLGSCTMKYNPRVNEAAARLPGFLGAHPLQDPETVQGAMELAWELQEYLQEITGTEAVSLQPAAGAQGEVTALFMITSWFRNRGEKRTKVLVPDSSHGTNPASAALAGFEVVTIPSNDRGDVDLEALRQNLDDQVACLMLTNPSTLGLFDGGIEAIARAVHAAGAMLYYDGANMNALMGLARPGDMGFDLVHLNLHKTFSTPHGGGGPGSGPVGARGEIARYLPGPRVGREDGRFVLVHPEKSIGRVRTFWGNFLVLVRAYAYIRSLGAEGLREVSLSAVLAANYLRARLRDTYELPYDVPCMHEFVLSARRLKQTRGVRALDVAKRLLDYGFYAPTVYFPLIVDEALMVEPTETEDLETLDAFVEAMERIAAEPPDLLHSAPHETPVGRLDEVLAARKPVLTWPEQGPAPG